MNDTYDGLQVNDLCTTQYLEESHKINSDSIGKIYDLKYRADLTAQEVDKNHGINDDSYVVQLTPTSNAKEDI